MTHFFDPQVLYVTTRLVFHDPENTVREVSGHFRELVYLELGKVVLNRVSVQSCLIYFFY